MDRFITRIPQPPREVRITVHAKPPSLQSRIEDLSGVVPRSRVEALRDELTALHAAAAPPADLLRVLGEADALRIALETLEITGVGRSVHRLRKHGDAAVAAAATAVEKKWMSIAADGLETRARRERKGLAVPSGGKGGGQQGKAGGYVQDIQVGSGVATPGLMSGAYVAVCWGGHACRCGADA